jgi:hypothetical protein
MRSISPRAPTSLQDLKRHVESAERVTQFFPENVVMEIPLVPTDDAQRQQLFEARARERLRQIELHLSGSGSDGGEHNS